MTRASTLSLPLPPAPFARQRLLSDCQNMKKETKIDESALDSGKGSTKKKDYT